MTIAIRRNDPDAIPAGNESVEFTFWFDLDGSRTADEVCEHILMVLENEHIEGVQYNNTFRSPFAKLYSK